MSEPARDLPADGSAVASAVENARRGVITHLTIGGERVAAIVPESVIEALRAVEDAEDAAEADAAMDEPGESIPWELGQSRTRPVRLHDVATYSLDVRPRAQRSLRQLDPPVRKAIAETIDDLATDPDHQACGLSLVIPLPAGAFR